MVSLALGVDMLASQNSGNVNEFSGDLSFFAVADNMADISQWTGIGAPAARLILARSWIAQENTLTTDTTGYTMVVTDQDTYSVFSKLPGENSKVYLLVSSTASFSGAVTEYQMADLSGAWMWTGDLDDGQFFTFATALPEVVLSVSTGNLAEATGTIEVTLFTTGDIRPAQDVTVTLTYSGTATDITDYDTNGTLTFTILSGSTGGSFILTGIQDMIAEGNESIVIEIESVLNAAEYGTQAQNLTIIDDDIAEVLLSVDTGAIDENAGLATFTAYTSGDVISETGIVITLIYSGTSINGSDYTT